MIISEFQKSIASTALTHQPIRIGKCEVLVAAQKYHDIIPSRTLLIELLYDTKTDDVITRVTYDGDVWGEKIIGKMKNMKPLDTMRSILQGNVWECVMDSISGNGKIRIVQAGWSKEWDVLDRKGSTISGKEEFIEVIRWWMKELGIA